MTLLLEMIVFVLLAMIAWKDFRTMEIPDAWNLALGICGIAAIFIEQDISVSDRIIGAVCVSVPMYLLILLIPESFGGGDVKLTFAMGMYLGWKNMLTGTFLAFLIGGCQAVYLLAAARAKVGERAHMAFGPALCLGFVVAKLCGDELLDWYLRLFL